MAPGAEGAQDGLAAPKQRATLVQFWDRGAGVTSGKRAAEELPVDLSGSPVRASAPSPPPGPERAPSQRPPDAAVRALPEPSPQPASVAAESVQASVEEPQADAGSASVQETQSCSSPPPEKEDRHRAWTTPPSQHKTAASCRDSTHVTPGSIALSSRPPREPDSACAGSSSKPPSSGAAPSAQTHSASASAGRLFDARLDAVQAADLKAQFGVELRDILLGGLPGPLLPSPPAQDAPKQAFAGQALVALVAWRSEPASAVAAEIAPLFEGPGGVPLGPDLIKSRLVDLAVRRSFAPYASGAAAARILTAAQASCGLGEPASETPTLAALDPLEDPDARKLWRWEPREVRSLPQALRAGAAAAKKRARAAQARAGVLLAALAALEGHAEGPCSAKLARALDKARGEAGGGRADEGGSAGEATPATSATLDRAAEKAAREAQRQAEKQEREAAKEAEKREKEAAREREREAKEAAREREREAKEAAREAAREAKQQLRDTAEQDRKTKKMEKEQEKLSKKAGFKDASVLVKTQGALQSFLRKAPDAHAAESPTPLEPQHGGGGSSAEEASAASREEREAAVDRALTQARTPDQCAASFESWRRDAGARLSRAAGEEKRRFFGLPPSWSRRTSAATAAEALGRRLACSGLGPDSVALYRRKFLWFPADSRRPAYFGSWGRGALRADARVGGRRPLGRHPALDYDVMSDLDWEEEPEGSSLSQADNESDGGEGEVEGGEGDEDSFLVADGYLSQDEGVSPDDDEACTSPGWDAQVAPDGISPPAGPPPRRSRLRGRLSALQSALDKARRSGVPLVLAAGDGAEDGARAGMLQALAWEVLDPRGRIEAWARLAAEAEPSSAGAAASECGAEAKAKRARLDEGAAAEALEELAAFCKSRRGLKRPEMAAAFQEEQLRQGRKLAKGWIAAQLKELLGPARPKAGKDGAKKEGAEKGKERAEKGVEPSDSTPAAKKPRRQVALNALVLPLPRASACEPSWRELVALGEAPERLIDPSVASALAQACSRPDLPLYVVSALLGSLAWASPLPAPAARALGGALLAACQALARGAEAAAELPAASSASQQAWTSDLTGPTLATLERLREEPALRPALDVLRGAGEECASHLRAMLGVI